jgi:Stress responsive A/B Barrel Domain
MLKHTYDLVLNSDFADAHALRAHQEHPDHVRVVEFLRKVHAGRIPVDYLV